ncbi:MAG: family 10 glycosylhydrolase [Fimbriimonadaceae bacterium]|nr:family 10 glycosylhydrolase [Fimbriimonadaceae bacterium]
MFAAWAALVSLPAPVALPEPMREFRAAWVATVANIDWPSKPGLTTPQLKAELVAIADLAQELKLNALIFQVRPHADAMYASKIEPWSPYITGQTGKAPSPLFDPLQTMIELCHARGIELHAWFNPYRAWHPRSPGTIPDNHVAKTHPDSVKKYGEYLWMDPGDAFVQKRTHDVMMDVATRYDLDGIHIDDYFYPYPVRGQDFPDEPSWQASLKEKHGLSRSDWRRRNVDRFIEKYYKELKKAKPWVKFGISPFGIYRPGIPKGIQAGVDQYEGLYADALKWFELGWCDYYTPQLYWPIEQTPQSYPVLLDWWVSVNKAGRHLWPGNFTSRLNPSDGAWKFDQLKRQIELTREKVKHPGNVHFSFKAFSNNWAGVTPSLIEGPYAKPALVPAFPWLDAKPPKAPHVTYKVEGDQWTVKWKPGDSEDHGVALVNYETAQGWSETEIVGRTKDKASFWTMATGMPTRVAVRLADRNGNVSEPTVVPAG